MAGVGSAIAAAGIGAAGSIGAAAISKPKAAKDPYAYLRPYMQNAAGQAQDLYSQGGPEVYQGSTVAGPSDTTQQALLAQLQRSQGGSALVDQAKGFVQQGLQQPIQSGYGAQQNPYAGPVNPAAEANPYASNANPFGGASNPYLDQTYNHALDSAVQGVQSRFATSGRNLNAGIPVAGDIASNLAAQIYAPAYESERNRQLSYDQQQQSIGANSFDAAQGRRLQAGLQGQQIGAQGYENAQQRQLQDVTGQRALQQSLLGYAQPLANQDYTDIANQRDVGSAYDTQNQAQLTDHVNTFNQNQQRPYQNLQQLIASLSQLGGGTGQYPQQQSTDYLSAGVGGALLGSSLYGQKQATDPLSPYTINGAAANGGYKYPSSGGNFDLYSSLGLL